MTKIEINIDETRMNQLFQGETVEVDVSDRTNEDVENIHLIPEK